MQQQQRAANHPLRKPRQQSSSS
uniref:Uncharacterized protein n=1 Tax=Arundo donax TaxID=35708 RepID=A0A0A9F4R0_ARUDO